MVKKISIITANYNGLRHLKNYISSIKKQTYKNLEIVFVDNNSTDKSIQFIQKEYSKAKIIKNKKNLGFAEANNIGVIKSTGEFIFFLNNDTELFPDTLEALMNNYQQKSILTAYQIPYRDKALEGRAGGGMDLFGYTYVNHNNLKSTKIFYADGAALFIKKSDFLDLGMFDDKLYMFQEDVDLSWRAQLKGYRIIPVWNAKLYHYYGGTATLTVKDSKTYVSSYFRRYLNEKNIIRNILKNYSFPLVIFILVVLLTLHLVEILLFCLLRKFKIIECYLKAYLWNIKNINDTLTIRKKNQKNRKVSDLQLFKKMYWTYAKLNLFLKLGLPEFK